MATHSSVLAWRIRDGGAWWAAVYGVAQSRTRLKRQQQQQPIFWCLANIFPFSIALLTEILGEVGCLFLVCLPFINNTHNQWSTVSRLSFFKEQQELQYILEASQMQNLSTFSRLFPQSFTAIDYKSIHKACLYCYHDRDMWLRLPLTASK